MAAQKPNRGRGRPPKAAADRLSAKFMLPVNAEIRQAIDQITPKGKSSSEVIRNLILKARAQRRRAS